MKYIYAAVIWDPFHLDNVQQLEKIQRRAARWVLNDFSRYSSVLAMIDHLSWPSLELRRKVSRLQNTLQHYSLAIPSCFIPTGSFITHPIIFCQIHVLLFISAEFLPTIDQGLG